MQFDDFQIVSSSHDDTILIWDFLDSSPPDPMEVDGEISATQELPKELFQRHSSEEPDSPTRDEININFPEEEGGSPAFSGPSPCYNLIII